MTARSTRALLALMVALGTGAISGCSSAPDGSPQPAPILNTPDPGDTEEPGPIDRPTDSGRSDLDPLTAPMRVSGLRWAHTNVPRTVPEPDQALPSLLDDPPGRALVVSYVPRPSIDFGFSDEAVEFYGTDGRWRRLDLGDLDLPEDGWRSGDTYGAGALSPNGRWWAGPMHDGMFLVDLRNGSATVRRVAGQGGHASFVWSPDSDELVLILADRRTRVSVPDMEVQPFPRPRAFTRILRDGGWRECAYHRHVVVRCGTYGPDGALVDEHAVPDDLKQKWAGPRDVAAGAVFYSISQGSYGNYRHDWEVVRTDADFEADARLILPAKSEINGVDEAFNSNALELAALNRRLLLAWLVDQRTIVKVIQPGVGSGGTGQDFWDITYARNLVVIR